MRKELKQIVFKKKVAACINFAPFNNRFRIKRGNEIGIGGVIFKSKITVRGQGNHIIIGEGCVLKNCIITINGNRNTLVIGENCRLDFAELYFEDDGGNITLGSKTNLTGRIHIACIEGRSVTIGANCLFSSDIVIRTGDSHSITDMRQKRINPSMNVNIRNHVWVGNQVIILKGADIMEDSVVGSGSIVTGKRYDRNSVICGNPARIVKTEVNWNHVRI